MAMKIIQVPLDQELLETLNRLSRRRQQSRSQLIREACRRYIETMERRELDRLYEEGYRRVPETAEMGEIQEAAMAEILEDERW